MTGQSASEARVISKLSLMDVILAGPGRRTVPTRADRCHDVPMRSNPLRTMFQSFGRRQWFSTTFRGVAPSIDRFLLRATKGRVALLTAAGLPTLLLTTTGRKSGEPRTVPLLFTVHDGAFVVIGSNWGQR